jgi:hypothetical protein
LFQILREGLSLEPHFLRYNFDTHLIGGTSGGIDLKMLNNVNLKYGSAFE